uniref:Uncharacterized protein n=1 Tax=Arundo donax TaxID=35708 RepID=A0A0A9DG46_ARUDO
MLLKDSSKYSVAYRICGWKQKRELFQQSKICIMQIIASSLASVVFCTSTIRIYHFNPCIKAHGTWMVPGSTTVEYTRLFLYPFVLFIVQFWSESRTQGAKDHESTHVKRISRVMCCRNKPKLGFSKFALVVLPNMKRIRL